MMAKRSSTSSVPFHRSNPSLGTWGPIIRKAILYLRSRNKKWNIPTGKGFEIMDMFWDLSFKAMMHGYTNTWPCDVRRMELHAIIVSGKLRTKGRHARFHPTYPDAYPGIIFVIEPAGSRFINYGYDFLPDQRMLKQVVNFMNENPEVAKKLLP